MASHATTQSAHSSELEMGYTHTISNFDNALMGCAPRALSKTALGIPHIALTTVC